MSEKDTVEFESYLANCTNRQVQGVFDKEQSAGRSDYARMAKQEMRRRGI